MNYLPALTSAMREVNRQSLIAAAGIATIWLLAVPIMDPVTALCLAAPLVLAVLCCILSAILYQLLVGLQWLANGLIEAWREVSDRCAKRHSPVLLMALGWRPTTHHDDGGIGWLIAILLLCAAAWMVALLSWGVIRWPTKNKRKRRWWRK